MVERQLCNLPAPAEIQMHHPRPSEFSKGGDSYSSRQLDFEDRNRNLGLMKRAMLALLCNTIYVYFFLRECEFIAWLTFILFLIFRHECDFTPVVHSMPSSTQSSSVARVRLSFLLQSDLLQACSSFSASVSLMVK